jgi:acetyltransferase
LIEIARLDAAIAARHLDDLRELLTDAVEDGAAVTFLAPIPRHQAARFWRDRIEAVTAGTCVLLAAFDGGRLVGSVQVNLDTPPNQRHRADINKLVVLKSARRRGIARALMEAAHREALAERRTLLTLDTRKDDAADSLYRSLGYVEIGVIPRYSRNSEGTLDDAVFFYKQLG